MWYEEKLYKCLLAQSWLGFLIRRHQMVKGPNLIELFDNKLKSPLKLQISSQKNVS